LIYGTLETISGGYLYDRKLVEYLRRQGDDVSIISLPWRNYIRHLGDNLSLSLLHRLEQLPLDVLFQDELNHPLFFLLNRLLRARVGYPIVSIVHHLRSNEAPHAWQNRFYRWVERRYLLTVDGFVFNSRTTRHAVESLRGGESGLRSWLMLRQPGATPRLKAARSFVLSINWTFEKLQTDLKTGGSE